MDVQEATLATLQKRPVTYTYVGPWTPKQRTEAETLVERSLMRAMT